MKKQFKIFLVVLTFIIILIIVFQSYQYHLFNNTHNDTTNKIVLKLDNLIGSKNKIKKTLLQKTTFSHNYDKTLFVNKYRHSNGRSPKQNIGEVFYQLKHS
jgi:hypothetical protein